jgi:hypothetical protein
MSHFNYCSAQDRSLCLRGSCRDDSRCFVQGKPTSRTTPEERGYARLGVAEGMLQRHKIGTGSR